MKHLLCDFQSNNLEDVNKHYIDFQNVDGNNNFFINLLKKENNTIHGKKYLRYNEVLSCSRFKVNHDFLADYDADENAFEKKLLTIQTWAIYES